jgi:hypothetical protein
MLIPGTLSVYGFIQYRFAQMATDPLERLEASTDSSMAIFSLAVAGAPGLITSGVLLRKRRNTK